MRAPARRPSRRPGLVVGAVVAALLLPAAPAAWAFWSTTAQVSATLSAAAGLLPPVSTCTTVPGNVLVGASARIAWDPVTGASGYSLTVRDGAGTVLGAPLVLPATQTSQVITTGLLDGLLGGLLNLLLGSGSATVAVTALHPTGWNSSPGPAHPVRLTATLVTGFECGAR